MVSYGDYALTIPVLEQALHRHILQAQQGLLPPIVNPHKLKHVLDVYCHTGSWVTNLARSYPKVRVTGIDSNASWLKVARQNAEIGNLERVLFYEFIPNNPLPLADESCDLVHLFPFLSPFLPDEWPLFLGQCQRVMKTGGYINLANLSWGPGSGKAYSRIILLMEQLLYLQGYNFSGQPGPISPGIFLSHLLKKAGFANVTYTITPINFGGWNNPTGRICFQLLIHVLHTFGPLFLKHGLIDEKGFKELLEQQQQEIDSLHFCLTAALISVLAIKK